MPDTGARASTTRQRAPVGVVASSQQRAQDLIRELGLTDAVALPRCSDSIEGMRLHAVIIDESAYPLPDHFEHTLYADFIKTTGHGGMYTLQRIAG